MSASKPSKGLGELLIELQRRPNSFKLRSCLLRQTKTTVPYFIAPNIVLCITSCIMINSRFFMTYYHSLINSKKVAANASWGRNGDPSALESIFALGFVLLLPTIVVACWVTLTSFHGSSVLMLQALTQEGFVPFLFSRFPKPSWNSVIGYAAWICFQAVLYSLIPGTGTGQVTPGGRLLVYKVNGLLAWQITVSLFLIAVYHDFIKPTVIAENWEGLLFVANLYGYALAIVAFAKAHLLPSHPADRKFTGSVVYDFWMGVELNPRFGVNWDWKLFQNGRPGIIAWSIIDLSFVALQYENFGYVSNSMITVVLLHNIYIVDFFVNENWYLRTMDIAHDHFGFYLAWGSAIWLPAMYTLQVQYLARYPVDSSTPSCALILIVGVAAYAIFRYANYEKDLVRRTHGNCLIWGMKPHLLRAPYVTRDGQKHESILLHCGWWKYTRHTNYLADLVLSFCMCAPCGTGHILPWFYFAYMLAVLGRRCYRVEKRCSKKYGKTWDEYKSIVPYILLPGII